MLKNKLGQTYEEFLRDYDSNKFQKPSCTVDMLLFSVENKNPYNYRKSPEKALKVLMVERGDFPFLGEWSLPGGFVNINEDLDTAAQRELFEETNVENVYMEQLYTWGDTNRDPRTRVISTSYMALVDSSKLNVHAGDDASDAKWFELKRETISEKRMDTDTSKRLLKEEKLELINDNIKLSATVITIIEKIGHVVREDIQILESNGIAFDHAKIILYGLNRLRNKVEYTEIVFNLMPEYFTLTELQKVYEIILGKELIKANFRRKIQDMVEETDIQTEDLGHRPATLYKYKDCF